MRCLLPLVFNVKCKEGPRKTSPCCMGAPTKINNVVPVFYTARPPDFYTASMAFTNWLAVAILMAYQL